MDTTHAADIVKAAKALRASLLIVITRVDESYGQNTLHLVLGVAYLRKMLENAGVVRYLSQHHADVLGEFQKLVESPDLKSAT